MKIDNPQWKTLKLPILAALLSLSFVGSIHATVIPTDISITAETTFDDAFSDGVSSGDFSLIAAGTSTASTYSGSGFVGDNPLGGSITDINDGIGFTGNATATDNFFFVGFDSYIDVANNSLSDIYDIVFKLVFSNTVNASGQDAYADSEFTLSANGSEIFFTDLLSDSLNGNEIGGVANGNFGSESAADTLFFNFALNPTDLLTLDLRWTLEGVDSFGDSSAFDFSQFLSIESVTLRGGQVPPSVPAPGTLSLFVIALVGLVARNVRKNK
jgi:hypothetical protein